MRGPPPKPTALLKLNGSWRAAMRKNEPQATGVPVCPKWLTGDARKLWKALVRQLKLLKVVGKIDGHMLARYCRLWQRWREAEEFLAKNGMIYSYTNTRTGCIVVGSHPLVHTAQLLATELTRIEREFGMSPASRARLRVEPQSEESDFDAYLRYNPQETVA